MGKEDFSLGVGAVAVRFTGTTGIHVISPIYLVPNDTVNNSPPGSMKLFFVFKSTRVEPL